jgi:hypothetical protein
VIGCLRESGSQSRSVRVGPVRSHGVMRWTNTRGKGASGNRLDHTESVLLECLNRTFAFLPASWNKHSEHSQDKQTLVTRTAMNLQSLSRLCLTQVTLNVTIYLFIPLLHPPPHTSDEIFRMLFQVFGGNAWYQSVQNIFLFLCPINKPKRSKHKIINLRVFVRVWNLVCHSEGKITEQSPSWEANSHSATQEIPRPLRNPKVHYRVHVMKLLTAQCSSAARHFLPLSNLFSDTVKELRNTTTNVAQYSRSRGRDCNPGPSGYEAGELVIQPRYQVHVVGLSGRGIGPSQGLYLHRTAEH